ncbi:MAG: glyoxalase [Planctomycetota bacterium]|nr:MAG: glyoxalase [Planctomycetota bacterium]
MIKKIAFISHHSSDIEKDKQFWGELLGLEKTAEYSHEGQDQSWVEFDTPDGKSIAIEDFSPAGSPPTLALETDDIEAEVARLKEAGVSFENDGQIMDNKVCKMAFVRDPSGNMVILHQIAPERAKD